MSFAMAIKKLLKNGRTRVKSSNSIQFSSGDTVVIDGSKINDVSVSKRGRLVLDDVELDCYVKIEVEGPTKPIQVDYCNELVVNGDAESIEVASGDVTVEGSVKGDAKTSQGNVFVKGDVEGSARTSKGDVRVGGSLRALAGDGEVGS